MFTGCVTLIILLWAAFSLACRAGDRDGGKTPEDGRNYMLSRRLVHSCKYTPACLTPVKMTTMIINRLLISVLAKLLEVSHDATRHSLCRPIQDCGRAFVDNFELH